MFRAEALVAVVLLATVSLAAAQTTIPKLSNTENQQSGIGTSQPQNHGAAANQNNPTAAAASPDRPIVVNIQEPKRSQADAEREKQDRDERAQTDRWMLQLTALIAFATAAQAFILAVTIYTSLKQLRPYVSAIPNWLYSFDDKTIAQARVEVKNRGVTPAFEVSSVISIDIFQIPLPKGFKFPGVKDTGTPPSALFPDAAIDHHTVAPRIFSQPELDQLVAGTHGLFVFGTVTYQRFRFFKHKTRFARRVTMDQKSMQRLVEKTKVKFDVSFVTAPYHNDAT